MHVRFLRLHELAIKITDRKADIHLEIHPTDPDTKMYWIYLQRVQPDLSWEWGDNCFDHRVLSSLWCGHEGHPGPEAGPGRNFAQNMQSAAERLRPASPDMTSLTLLRKILLWWSHACLMKKHSCWLIWKELCPLFSSFRSCQLSKRLWYSGSVCL